MAMAWPVSIAAMLSGDVLPTSVWFEMSLFKCRFLVYFFFIVNVVMVASKWSLHAGLCLSSDLMEKDEISVPSVF